MIYPKSPYIKQSSFIWEIYYHVHLEKNQSKHFEGFRMWWSNCEVTLLMSSNSGFKYCGIITVRSNYEFKLRILSQQRSVLNLEKARKDLTNLHTLIQRKWECFSCSWWFLPSSGVSGIHRVSLRQNTTTFYQLRNVLVETARSTPRSQTAMDRSVRDTSSAKLLERMFLVREAILPKYLEEDKNIWKKLKTRKYVFYNKYLHNSW